MSPVDEWKIESTRLVREGDLLGAIKHCRTATGWGLIQAKEECEALKKTYYEYLNEMDEDVREIALAVWDETGRPHNEYFPVHPKKIAVLKLLAVMSETEDANGRLFITKYRQLFPSDTQTDEEIDIYYASYIDGIKRCAKALGLKEDGRVFM